MPKGIYVRKPRTKEHREKIRKAAQNPERNKKISEAHNREEYVKDLTGDYKKGA